MLQDLGSAPYLDFCTLATKLLWEKPQEVQKTQTQPLGLHKSHGVSSAVLVLSSKSREQHLYLKGRFQKLLRDSEDQPTLQGTQDISCCNSVFLPTRWGSLDNLSAFPSR